MEKECVTNIRILQLEEKEIMKDTDKEYLETRIRRMRYLDVKPMRGYRKQDWKVPPLT